MRTVGTQSQATLSIVALAIGLLLSACRTPESLPLLPESFERPIVWSNVRLTGGEDPHAYGLQMELWRQEREFAGFVAEYVGPPADAPAGRLDEITFDESTGIFTFVSKLSVGVVLSEDGKSWIPARNEYAFSGQVSEDTLTGMLQRRTVQPNGKVVTEDEQITLERDRTKYPDRTPVVYSDWLDAWNKILEARGPRW